MENKKAFKTHSVVENGLGKRCRLLKPTKRPLKASKSINFHVDKLNIQQKLKLHNFLKR
jgi:hypothetical protein